MKTTTDAEIEQWNTAHPVGSPCYFRMQGGTELRTKTRSEAWRVPDGGPVVVLIKGRNLGVTLDRVKMLETHKP